MNMSTKGLKGDQSESLLSLMRNPQFISIYLISVLMNLSKQMSNSILSKYVDSLGATATVIGLVSSIFALAALIFKFIAGPALDSWNRKHIIICAMAVMGIAFVGYSLSTAVPMIVVFRFVQGAAQAFTATCLLAMVADSLPAKLFSTGVGMYALFESVAQAIGPTVGLGLVGILGYRNTFAISAILMFASTIVVMFIRQPTFVKTNKLKISLYNIFAKECIPFAFILLIFNMCFCVVSTYLVIYAGNQGVEGNIGIYFTVYACAMLMSRPLVGKLTDRLGIVKILIPAMGCFVAGYWLISYATSLWMLIVAAIISAFGLGACQPVVQALCMKCVPPHRRGVASSTCYIAQDFGNLIGPIVAGFAVEHFGYSAMWRMMTVPILFACAYVLIMRGKISRVEHNFLQ